MLDLWHPLAHRPLNGSEARKTQLLTVILSYACAGDRDAPIDRLTRDAVAIGLATGAYAVSYGVLAVAAGPERGPDLRDVAARLHRRLAVRRGQRRGGRRQLAAALAPAIGLAARNGVYGLSMVPFLPRCRWRRAAEAQLVIDESTAMARAQDTPQRAHRAFLATGLAHLRLLEPRHARRRAARDRPRRPARPRPRRDVPRRLPGPARAAAAPAGRAGRGDRRRPRRVAMLPVLPTGLPILVAVVGVIPAVAVAAAPPSGAPRELVGAPAAGGGRLRDEGGRPAALGGGEVRPSVAQVLDLHRHPAARGADR